MNKGRLIVFSAPSGCGKGTMLGEIMKDERFRLSVSATTRDPRPGEIDGVNYHFITREEFEKRIENGEFLEHAEYCGNLYGSLVNEADPYLEQGLNVVLEIEVQGAMQIREKRPDALFVFIAPPSMAEIRRRLLKRGTETPEVIEQRIAQATMELGYAQDYDYIIVNDALEDAVADFFTVIRAEQVRAPFMSDHIEEVIKNA
ncbi:MAG: guanylate kinase [Ruminococcus sp.]|nr:guanylate kinase [Ruminococcus sp.]